MLYLILCDYSNIYKGNSYVIKDLQLSKFLACLLSQLAAVYVRHFNICSCSTFSLYQNANIILLKCLGLDQLNQSFIYKHDCKCEKTDNCGKANLGYSTKLCVYKSFILFSLLWSHSFTKPWKLHIWPLDELFSIFLGANKAPKNQAILSKQY